MLSDIRISSTAALLLVMVFICAYGAFRIRRRSLANPQNELLRYFGNFFLSLTVFSILFVTPFLLFPEHPKWPVWGYVFAQFFFGLAMSFLGAFVARSFNKPAYWGMLPVLLIAITEFILHITHLPVYDVAALSTYNIQKVVPFKAAGALIGLKAITPIIPLGFIMIRQAIKIPAARSRSLLIFFGLLLMVIGGPMHDFADEKLFVVADIITLLGIITILAGLLIEPKTQPAEPQTIQQ